jgi:hypothetical protein
MGGRVRDVADWAMLGTGVDARGWPASFDRRYDVAAGTMRARHSGRSMPLTTPTDDRARRSGWRVGGAAEPAIPAGGLATVRELLGVGPLRLTLVAGATGLDRPIRWAHAIELLDPRSYLRGGELVLTMDSVIRDDVTCRQFNGVRRRIRVGGWAGRCARGPRVPHDLPPEPRMIVVTIPNPGGARATLRAC